MKKILVAIILFLMLPQLALAGRNKKDEFVEKKSAHFIVYYKDIPENFVDTVIEYGERYYDELTEELGFRRFDYWTWDRRAKIYLYPDKETYAKETKNPLWSKGAASYRDKTIWTYPSEAGFFDTLLPHELGHIIFREVIGFGRKVPLWLEEGVASYLEKARRIGAERIVLKAVTDGTFLPIEELNKVTVEVLKNSSDDFINLFYAESVGIVAYLVNKYGSGAFNDFCKKLKDGKTFDRALSYAYYYIRSSSDLSNQWEEELKDKLGMEYKKRCW